MHWEYLVYYYREFDNKMLYAFVKGRSEADCWRTACQEFGEKNIYSFVHWKGEK